MTTKAAQTIQILKYLEMAKGYSSQILTHLKLG